MKAVIQRVSHASVVVDDKTVAEIGQGLLVLYGVEKGDDKTAADKLTDKMLRYRLFADEDDKMNLSVLDKKASILMVSQFTLAADTQKGLRPSFSSAMPPEQAKEIFDYSVEKLKQSLDNVQTGVFGADMKVSLLNDGPVTFLLEV